MNGIEAAVQSTNTVYEAARLEGFRQGKEAAKRACLEAKAALVDPKGQSDLKALVDQVIEICILSIDLAK